MFKAKYLIINAFLALLVLITTTSLRILLPFLLSQFINDFYNGYSPINDIIFYTICFISLFIFMLLQKFLIEKLTWQYTNHLRQRLLSQIIKSDDYFMQKYSLGDILEYFEEDINKIYIFISSALPNLISSIITIVFVVTFFTLKFIWVLPFFLIYLLLDIMIVKYFRNNNQIDVLNESNYHEEMNGQYSEWLSLRKTIKATQTRSSFLKRINLTQDQWLKYRLKSNKFHYTMWCILLLLNVFFDITILAIAGFLFFSNLINVGSVYLYYALGKKVQAPMESLQINFQAGVKAFYSLKRINNLCLYQSNLKDGSIILNTPITKISSHNLVFTYNDGELILNNINLSLKAGDKIGIYGKSGDGKSTLCKVFAKIINPNDNSIMVNDLDVNLYNLESYYKEIAYFNNDAYIMKASIYDNLVMYDH
ncbi:MAG: ABC transporter transmembrane domain-containing protein, partial [Bacilli bacterium]